MTTRESPIRGISDTARWVAVYRARESARPDAVFNDPFAKRLAGEVGERIDASMPFATRNSWPFVARTWLIDELIDRQVREGADLVINLASGLDTRPYRMELPGSLQWVEVDLPEILDYKDQVLRHEKPSCALRRVRMDLSDEGGRRELFEELSGGSRRALVVAEGFWFISPRKRSARWRVTWRDDPASTSGFSTWLPRRCSECCART